MRATIETHLDLLFCDIHGGGHVDEVAEDDPGLRIGVAAHLAGEQSVQATGDDQQGHVEVDPQADGGGQRIDVKEASWLAWISTAH
jgi:hypothetical protein